METQTSGTNFATVRTVQKADFIIKVIEFCDVIWFTLKKNYNKLFNILSRNRSYKHTHQNLFQLPSNISSFSYCLK